MVILLASNGGGVLDVSPCAGTRTRFLAGTTCEVEVRVACGGILPGDCNQDGFVGVSDSICLLNVLFGGGGFSAVELPCADHGASDPANRTLLSWDNDPSLGLSDAIALLNWRFLGGPPHPLGTACQRIDGCPDVCSLDPPKYWIPKKGPPGPTAGLSTTLKAAHRRLCLLASAGKS
jgi:hypothetical protein